MTDRPPSELSAAGEQRRDAILRLAVREGRLRRRGRMRRLAAAGLSVAVILAAFSIAHRQGRREMTSTPRQRIAVAQTPNAVRPVPPAADLVDQWAIKPKPSCWQVLDDDETLRYLSEHGQEAGILSINGKTLLLLHK